MSLPPVIKRIRSHLKLGFLFIPLSLGLLVFGWQKWSATAPQPLPTGDSQGKTLAFGRYYEATISPVGRANGSARYRLWLPDGVQRIRGLIVKQHGCGDPAAATGLDHANDLQWQALALKHQFALVGVKLPTGYPLCTDEALQDRATERAFLQGLTALVQESNHPEVDQVPWVLWGHSGGADWGMQMLRYYPERVIAVVNMRCGGILNTSYQSEVLNLKPESVAPMLNVPVLWAVGGKDSHADECVALPKQIFSKYRGANAAWTIAIEPNAQHESGNSRFLAIPYLDAILSKRLMPSGGIQLRPINLTQGWLGNPQTYDVAAINQYQGNPLQAAWLPDAAIAQKWQEYVKTGQVCPTRKPTAPVDVQARRVGATKVLLTWNFIPDLENGLPQFRIYRNNSLIRTFKGQEHNFGDAPDPPQVVLEFQDNEAPSDSVYAVAAVNSLGESRSESVK